MALTFCLIRSILLWLMKNYLKWLLIELNPKNIMATPPKLPPPSEIHFYKRKKIDLIPFIIFVTKNLK